MNKNIGISILHTVFYTLLNKEKPCTMFIIVSEAGKEGDEVQSNIEVTSTITTDNINTAGMPVMDYSEVVDEPFAISLSVTNAKFKKLCKTFVQSYITQFSCYLTVVAEVHQLILVEDPAADDRNFG